MELFSTRLTHLICGYWSCLQPLSTTAAADLGHIVDTKKVGVVSGIWKFERSNLCLVFKGWLCSVGQGDGISSRVICKGLAEPGVC
jgi:hypothetical protein